MDLGHAFMFGGYLLMNPRRCRPHRARCVSLKVPLDNFSQSFHTIFLLHVDTLERFLRHFEVLRFLWVHTQQRFPHQRVELLFYELVLALQTFFEPSPANRRRCNLENSDGTTNRNTFAPGCPFSKAVPNTAINTLGSALGRTCCTRSMNFNSGKGAPVATNRILSLLSPFVVTSVCEGGRGRQRITLMSVKRHGKQNVGCMCSWNSKMSFPPSRSNGKLRSLNT